jgi:hypothetical protein
MKPKTNLIVLIGGGLLIANILYDSNFATLRTATTKGTLSHSDVSSSPVKLVLVGILTLIALSLIADASDSAGNTILIALIGFWILWLISYQSQQTKGKANAKA